jgi:hypothetical protein
LPSLSFVRRRSVTPYSCIFITNNRIARIKIFSFTTIYIEPKMKKIFMIYKYESVCCAGKIIVLYYYEIGNQTRFVR